MKVTVVGAGKMGLPLACVLAANGASVHAADTNPDVVEAINAGCALFEEPGLDDLLTRAVQDGRLMATTDTSGAVADSDAVVVLVPALLTADRDADLSNLLAACAAISRGLQRGTLVSFETTVPIGSTRNRLGPALAAGGLDPGRDFDLVFSPERVKSQRVLAHLTENLKVVGGITPAAAERGTDFYHAFLGAPVMNVGSLEAAEMVKLAGMVYRDTVIGLANQLAEYSEAVGVDLAALLPAINSDGEAELLSPGIGVGGHCTPVYPYFYIRDAERRGVGSDIAQLARETNDDQAARTAARVEQSWRALAGEKVLLLGLGFRPEVKEDACSTTYLLRDALESRGASCLVHDPLYSDDEIRSRGFAPASLEGTLPPVVVLVTAHRPYHGLSMADLASRGVEVVIDGRNIWDERSARSAGLAYIGMGRPARSHCVPDGLSEPDAVVYS